MGLVVWALWLGAGSSALPQTHDITGNVHDDHGSPIDGAVCTLAGRGLSDRGITVTTGEQGEFQFPGLVPGTYDLTCVAVGREPVVRKGLELSEAQNLALDVVLPPEIIVRESVEVREKAPPITQQSTAPPATLGSQVLKSLPLTEQKFKAALPLVPGVVRTPDGKINIKGSVENQGILLVDSAESVDPVTGSFSIEVPIDAVESLEVYKSAYRAEYGRFSGGLTTIETKPPSTQWKFELNDFLPTLRARGGHIVGIADNRPRMNFTGPLWPNKLNFSESFTYDVINQPVRGLAWPHNETKTQGFNSFTELQYFFSPQHLLTANTNVFPTRQQFAGISSLIPQSASSDYGQRGFSSGFLDHYLFNSGGILTTLFRYTDFSSNAHGQGPEPMLVTPDGWGGNFFNTWRRTSHQEEAFQTFQFPAKHWRGKHELKLGGDLINRSYHGTTQSQPVLLLRPDGTLGERIDFKGAGQLAVKDTELSGFIQDHWAVNDQFAMDLGVRYSGQTIGDHAAVAPRGGVVYSPGSSGKTVLRSGVGMFFDRLPLLAGDYTSNLTRAVSLFDPDGVPLGAPVAFRNVYVKVDDKKRRIIPNGRGLSSTPQNVTWNAELDRVLRPHVVLRLSYLASRSYNIFIIDPSRATDLDPILLLTNTGVSRYHEFESTLRVRPGARADFNFSYVESMARGDLNTLSSVFVPFEQPVIRPNFFASLASNVPHRFISWARFSLPWQLTASPILDVHSGFPYSSVDVLQNYVGSPNSQRFPTFFAVDFQLTKDFHLPLIPWLKKHKLRAGFRIYNLTNHSNPRDVFNNVASPFFGHFVGFQHRIYDASFDIVY